MSEIRVEPELQGVQERDANLAQRLERVEHENAQLRKHSKLLMIGGAAVLGLLVLMLITRLVSGGAVGSVEARQFVLRDTDGMVRGIWEIADNGATRLVLRDRDARERVRLTLLPDGSPGLTLADRDGRPRTVLGLLPDQTATLVFADQAGKTRAVLGVPADGSSTMAFADRQGETRVNVGVDASGKPSVTMFENAAPAVEEPLAPIEDVKPVAPPATEEPQAPTTAAAP